MSLSEMHRVPAGAKEKPIVHARDGKCGTGSLFLPGNWDRQTFLERAIGYAESIGLTVTNYESAARRLAEIYGPLDTLPEEKQKEVRKLIREAKRPTSPSGRLAMKIFHRTSRVKRIENKRRIAESLFEFVAA